MRGLLLVLGLLGCAERERFYVQTSDGALLYTTVDGPADADTAVLVLHGGPRGDSHIYNSGRWSRRLEERHRMVYLDQRGQGASRGTFDRDAYDPQRAADDVAEVVDVLRARWGEEIRLVLLGHSWGGMLGSLALLDTDVGDHVDGWIETAGCHDASLNPVYARALMEEVGAAQIANGHEVEAWQDLLERARAVDLGAEVIDYGDLVTLNQLGYEAEGLVEELVWDDDGGLGNFLSRPARGSVATWAGSATLDQFRFDIESLDLTPRLGAIEVPTLLLYGTYDFVCPPEHGRDAAARIDGASLIILERSGHSLMFNEPDPFVDAVEGFLDDR